MPISIVLGGILGYFLNVTALTVITVIWLSAAIIITIVRWENLGSYTHPKALWIRGGLMATSMWVIAGVVSELDLPNWLGPILRG